MLTSSSSSSSSSSYPSSSSSAPSFHSATMTHDQPSANTGLETVLPQRITVLSSGTLPRHAARLTLMMHIIDNMGEASARAQGLRSPVTNLARLHQNPLHRLYVLRSGRDLGSTIQRDARPTSASRGGGRCDPSEGEETFLEAEPPGEVGADVIGMLKVGPKNLFVANRQGRQIQMCPLCVLDFFIHEKFQRSGSAVLHFLFHILKLAEGTSAELLAYDKPSRLLLSFLRKHYNLEDCNDWQFPV
ncbi:touch receptor neuron protein Mec-17-domain-containing protein [Zopfochytrium polystomum]|nr:touch receptor neuron protein Mec-17-domain-containing protein [Zopfochytrium polystomum]